MNEAENAGSGNEHLRRIAPKRVPTATVSRREAAAEADSSDSDENEPRLALPRVLSDSDTASTPRTPAGSPSSLRSSLASPRMSPGQSPADLHHFSPPREIIPLFGSPLRTPPRHVLPEPDLVDSPAVEIVGAERGNRDVEVMEQGVAASPAQRSVDDMVNQVVRFVFCSHENR